jgi:hypothetical protein
MPSGSSLKFMMEAIPERAFDVNEAEQHAVTLGWNGNTGNDCFLQHLFDLYSALMTKSSMMSPYKTLPYFCLIELI